MGSARIFAQRGTDRRLVGDCSLLKSVGHDQQDVGRVGAVPAGIELGLAATCLKRHPCRKENQSEETAVSPVLSSRTVEHEA